jgi:hypothetical protein
VNTPPELIEQLSAVGVTVRDIWDLVNTRQRYDPAIPILIDWLIELDDRAPPLGQDELREPIVRALTVPAARPLAAPVLIHQFRRVQDPTGTGIRWAIGNALKVTADDTVIDDLINIVQNQSYGRARQMIVEGLGRSRDPRVPNVLIDLLDDPDVVAHAIEALGRLRVEAALPRLEQLVHDHRPLVRREAQNAVKKVTAGR